MDQVVLPDVNKHNEKLLSMDKKVSLNTKSIEKLFQETQNQAKMMLKS